MTACIQGVLHMTRSECRNVNQSVVRHPRKPHTDVKPGHTGSETIIGEHFPCCNLLDLQKRYIIAIKIKSRAQLNQLIPKTLSMIYAYRTYHTNIFVSDNTREYLSEPVRAYLTSTACQNVAKIPHHPKMNVLTESINRNLFKAARTVLEDYSLQLQY